MAIVACASGTSSGKTEIICLLASELLRLGKADSVVVLIYAAPGPCDLSADYTSHMGAARLLANPLGHQSSLIEKSEKSGT